MRFFSGREAPNLRICQNFTIIFAAAKKKDTANFKVTLTIKTFRAMKSKLINLPEIPSAAEMKENGVSLDKPAIQLLQKVEECTLYIIEQEKRIEELENLINNQK